MSAVLRPAAAGAASLRSLVGASAAGEPWAKLRQAARQELASLHLPDRSQDGWRQIELAPLAALNLQRAGTPRLDTVAALVERQTAQIGPVAARLVFVDGHYIAALSAPSAGGVRVAVSSGEAAAKVGRVLTRAGRFFATLNSAGFDTAAVIEVEGRASAPVHIVHVAATPQAAYFPRSFVLVATGAEVHVVEEFVALEDTPSFGAAVSELHLQNGARASYAVVQRAAPSAVLLAHVAARLESAAELELQTVHLGGRLARIELDVDVICANAACQLDGLAIPSWRRVVATHSRVRFHAPDGHLRQVHKAIAGGAGRAVFDGTIVVEAPAQRCDATQHSRNLLLSERAQIDTRPQLDIHADDVKCAHGATVGRLNEDELFYLASRGLPEPAARALLIEAFAVDVVRRLPSASLARAVAVEISQLLTKTS